LKVKKGQQELRNAQKKRQNMPLRQRPAMPVIPPRLAAFRARQDRFANRVAMFVTVLAALGGVLIVAAAAVALAIT
jgi:hypothetical protein